METTLYFECNDIVLRVSKLHVMSIQYLINVTGDVRHLLCISTSTFRTALAHWAKIGRD